MSSISSVSAGVAQSIINAVAPRKSSATSVSTVRDSDGDFDGTKLGQVDGRDFGKGSKIDRRA